MEFVVSCLIALILWAVTFKILIRNVNMDNGWEKRSEIVTSCFTAILLYEISEIMFSAIFDALKGFMG